MKMTDKTDKKPGARKPLSLSSSGKGSVRQSLSGGRSKAVVVEKKKKVIIRPGSGGAPKVKVAPKISVPAAKPKVDEAAIAAKKLGLSKAEYEKRQAALSTAKAQADERDAKKAAEQAERQARMAEEKAALDAKKKEEEAAELRRLEAEEEKRQKEEAEKLAARKPVGAAAALKKEEDTRSEIEKAGGRVKKKRAAPPPTRSKGETKRRRGKLTIVSALAGNDDRQRSLASMKRAREREKQRQRGGSGGSDKVQREVVIPEAITVAELSNRMAERARDVVKYLMQQGTMATMNDVIDADTAQLIVEDFGHTVKRVSEADVEDNFIIDDTPSDEKDRKPRSPVIAVMGHVDHGKTSLLDALRTTDVASGEAGGITQHIGAYQLKLKSGEQITVLDTPGHAAFSEMRTRGAQAVDIVVLVVAADDGVMPQTIESIKYAQEAETPIIVAINKMDSYDANPQKVETDLLQHNIITESMSGETQAIPVSAKEKTGLDDLAEAIANQAELMELKANPTRNADGLVIESKIEKGRGPVATFLVKRGTLERGQIVVAGEYWGKVKAMMDERNAQLKKAGPSTPVEVMGLDGAPSPGEPFAVVETEQRARELTEYRVRKRKEDVTKASGMASVEQMMAKLANKTSSEMPLAEKEGVEIRYYSIIYGLLDEIKGALEGMLAPERKETFIGYAEVLEVFDISKLGKIAGAKVTEGRVERGSGVRLLRDDVVIHEGELSTLKRFKDEVPKVQAGMECGMGFLNYHDLRKGDQIECFTVEMLDRTLD